METEVVRFTGSEHELVGRLHPALGPTRAYALFAHCFTCSKDLRAAVRIGRALAERGIATLRFDFTGLGESSGDFADTNFSSNVADLLAAARHLEEHFEAPQLLVGHSLGGAAVLAAAAQIDACRAVATIGAPADPEHVAHLFSNHGEDIARDGEAEVRLAGRRFRIKKQLLDDLRNQCSAERIRQLGRSLLIMHSPTDTIVGIENAGAIYQAARHPKSFVSLDGADHLLSRAVDARYVADVLSAWAGRYLAPTDEVDVDVPRAVVVQGGRENFRQHVEMGPHTLVGDEPVSVGGDDSGPTPYDLLLAALGTCTSMTVRMYADRKGWPLEGVEVRMTHDKIHARDCEDCERETGKVDVIDRTLTVKGDLDESQRARLLAIADRCPVHRTLHGEVKIRSHLDDG